MSDGGMELIEVNGIGDYGHMITICTHLDKLVGRACGDCHDSVWESYARALNGGGDGSHATDVRAPAFVAPDFVPRDDQGNSAYPGDCSQRQELEIRHVICFDHVISS